jgi:outer membrane protein assembly factor BamA
VPNGQSLLNENHINVNKEGVKKSDLIPYIKQVPNKQIFGRKFYLGLYNLSNINKERWPNAWLRNIGEPPVIFDQTQATKSKEQIKSYVFSKGYFDGIVKDTVKTKDKKSDVYYNVDLRRPYTIHNLTYEIADTNIKNLCYFDSVNCLIVRGKPYDVSVVQAERLRFERFIRDHGFYGFTNDFIQFDVDSTVGNRQVNIKYRIKNFSRIDANNRVISSQFAVYTVKNIYIYPDYDPKEALAEGENYFESMDTTLYKGYYFVTSEKDQEIKYDLILKSLYIKAGSVYNVTNTEQTQSHLRNLKVYRLVNINFADAKENENLEGIELFLNCNIQLTLLSQQSYKIELEGTNSAGNLGGALNLVYQHKNLFHGAELLSMSLKGAYSAYKLDNKLRSVEEYGFETSLKFPKFIMPFFNTEGFIEKYNPSTNLTATYDYQSMPYYTRTLANASFGYNWKAGNHQEHFVNPLVFNLINVLHIDSAFEVKINTSSYQASSYKDVLILGGNYSFVYNNQNVKNSRDYWFLKVSAETAGNSAGLLESLSGGKKTQGTKKNNEGILTDTIKSYRILGLPFAQYVRTDLDLRYYYRINDASSVAYRGFVGVGIPYGNSREIPFERQYFGGGANGIRAWQVRTLGPGSYNPNIPLNPADTLSKVFLNETADIKLEANAEYRFKLFWIIESAIFIDAGNIWTFNKDDARKGSQFSFTKFYKDIAVGTGTGFRFDLKFVIARVDIGMKLRDPLNSRPVPKGLLTNPDPGSKWIFLNGPYERKDFTIVFGIGYPF